jgi:hypothetical protein
MAIVGNVGIGAFEGKIFFLSDHEAIQGGYHEHQENMFNGYDGSYLGRVGERNQRNQRE